MTGPTAAVRKPLDMFASITTFALCIVWGMQQVAIKAAAPAMDPVLQVGLRSFAAAILVAVFIAFARREAPIAGGTLGPGIWAALLFGSEFLVVSLGLSHTTASHMTVFLYTSPMFTAIGLHLLLPDERLRPAQWVGVLTAFAGLVVAFSASFGASAGTSTLLGDALGVLGAIFWALTTIVIRATRLEAAPAATTLLYQLIGAAVILLPLAWLHGNFSTITFTPLLWSSLIFQAVGVAFVSYLAWFWLLRWYRATPLSMFALLTPLFGVTFGVVLLHEPVSARFLVGAVLVLAGIVMVSWT
ncbi:MAG TPA: DMT family transporter [Gemmatimonadales bacterium]